MDAVSALLRAAIRIADASAAIVAFDDELTPVAFAGCSQAVATAAMRDGSGAYIDCDVAERPTTLVILNAARPTAGDTGLTAIACELGFVVNDATARFDEDLGALAKSIEALADPVVVYTPPRRGEEVARFAYVNAAFERLFGYDARELAGQTEDLLFGASTNMDNVGLLRERLALGEPVRSIVELRTREDVPLWI